MKYSPLNPKLFIKNRERFAKVMKPNSIAIFVSNDEVPSNGDALHKYEQNSDLFWLSGVNQENSMVVLFPNNPDPKYREVLVLTRPNDMKEKWYGLQLKKEEAQKISGIKTIVWLDSIDALLQPWIHLADNIYLDTNENDRKASLLRTADYRYIDDIKARYPLHNFMRAAKLMNELRAIKTPEEVEAIKLSCNITEKTFRRLLKFIKPGVTENQIEAEILHEYYWNKAFEAFPSIIASGSKGWILHYNENNDVCKDGDMVLIDMGAKYGGYCSDLTRTVPVNGKFSKRQREVYQACLNLSKYSESILKPNIAILKYHEMVGDKATEEFLKLGLITKQDVKNEDPDDRAYRKYLYHGISHHMGIDVHDLGTKAFPIKPGMVFTIEPGIYIKEEGISVRLENDFLITKTGNINLMKTIPILPDEIERLMKK